MKTKAPVVKLPAHQRYARGLRAYQERRYRDAEAEFLAAVSGDGQDARYHYFLGLARWPQGKREAAAEQFRQGAKLERENNPSQVFVRLALDAAQPEGLEALNLYRR